MSATEAPITTTSSRVAYENPWMRVREDGIVLPGNREGMYGVVEINESVKVIAENEDGDLFLIENYRYPRSEWSWEFPGGGGDGEPLDQAAARELLEETGLSATTFQELGRLSTCDGLVAQKQATFVATGLTLDREPDTSSDVIQGSGFFSPEDITRMISEGKIHSGETIASFMLYQIWRETNVPGVVPSTKLEEEK